MYVHISRLFIMFTYFDLYDAQRKKMRRMYVFIFAFAINYCDLMPLSNIFSESDAVYEYDIKPSFNYVDSVIKQAKMHIWSSSNSKHLHK